MNSGSISIKMIVLIKLKIICVVVVCFVVIFVLIVVRIVVIVVLMLFLNRIGKVVWRLIVFCLYNFCKILMVVLDDCIIVVKIVLINKFKNGFVFIWVVNLWKDFILVRGFIFCFIKFSL